MNIKHDQCKWMFVHLYWKNPRNNIRNTNLKYAMHIYFENKKLMLIFVSINNIIII